MWRFVGIVAVAVAVLGAGCGGGDGAALPAGQYDVGHGVTVTVGKVTDPVEVKVPDEMAKDIRNPVEPGTRWVAIDLEYFNHTDDVVDMTAAYGVTLQTSEGREAEGATPTFSKFDGREVPKAIPPHSSVKGSEVYDIPNGDKAATLLLYGHMGDKPVVVKL
jgi:hypothetical protein